jgi:hypothetical protein
MTDLPASWQTDPTGRHDHRYWDGTRWTEHVADAGVASTDPYDEPDEPAAPAPSAPSEPAAPPLTSGWATAQGAQPVGGEPEPLPESTLPEPTAGWGTALPAPTADTGAAPGSEGDGGSGSRAKRNLLIGAVLVVVVLIVAVLAIGGDDDDSSRSAVTSRIADSIRSDDDGISRTQADCIAKVIVDDVGLDRVSDIDFEADEPPKGDLGVDLGRAYQRGLDRCVSGGAPGGDSSPGAQLGDLSERELEEQLSSQYTSMGLDADKAECLGGKMAKALKDGDGVGNQAFGDFFDYLDECDVTLDELSGTTP